MPIHKLQADLSKERNLDELNRRVRADDLTLDWSGVTVAPAPALRRLLKNLDLVDQADALGLHEIPPELEDAVIAALEGTDRDEEDEPADDEATPPRTTRPAAATPNASEAELRALFVDMIRRDLLGPAESPEEEVDESRVRDRYLVGTLAPRRQRVAPEEQDQLGAESPAAGREDGASDEQAPARPSMYPSSLGITACVKGGTRTMRVEAEWGWYRRAPSERLVDRNGSPKPVWKRTPVHAVSPPIQLDEGDLEPWFPSAEQPQVYVKGRVRRLDDSLLVTLFLVNGQDEPEKRRDEAWLFQPRLSVTCDDLAPAFHSRPQLLDPDVLDSVDAREAEELALAYRRRVEFAVGHGVSVHAELSPHDPSVAVRIESRVIPEHEVRAVVTPTAEDNPDLADVLLEMKSLGALETPALVRALRPLAQAYEKWIARQQTRLESGADGLEGHREVGTRVLERCRTARTRIEEGIEQLASDEAAADAFRFAMNAMHHQRVRSLYVEGRRRDAQRTIAQVEQEEPPRWRAFQLAFILLNIPSITRVDHPDRSHESDAVADLLWFPTGGGKTEAYLGLAAYTMALRRLRGPEGGLDGTHGVAVLMRYTLRLLTLQQFQRAATLLCAMEVLRRERVLAGDTRLGQEPFRIGLWVGQRTTPNRTDDAAESLRQHRGGRPTFGSDRGSPAQLTTCPWCGTKIEPGRHLRVETASQGLGRTLTYCGDDDGECPFSERLASREGLPIVVVDEEIYRRLPSMLIATVDKFAQMPWNGLVQMLFGQVNGICPRHGFRSPEVDDAQSHGPANRLPRVRSEPHEPLRPPDLIIQDELHLISGPLGSLTGLYETAIDELCTWEVDGKRIRPKVIASTATIRRASEQVHGLFLRRVQVFPPPGLDVEDNFFAIERAPQDQPGRLYLGICAPGRRLKAALLRTYVAALAAGKQVYDWYGRKADPWMTAVGYFNSLRELAGMKRLVDDDVGSRLRDMPKRGLARRKRPKVKELTSRVPSTDIPDLLDTLELTFDPVEERKRAEARTGGVRSKAKPAPIDVLLATNMVSVGVDVKRLGLMITAGQPKTTAEYIQATSRVGRSHPGVVLTVYNWARPRDLSHYETFEHYHSTFYEHVEPTSVTPFSSRALDRGLSALLVSLVRLASPELNANDRAQQLARTSHLVERAVRAITRRALLVTESRNVADAVEATLQRRLDQWLGEAARTHQGIGSTLAYRQGRGAPNARALLKPAGSGPWEDFTVLNSLRDVEPTAGLIFDDHGLDLDTRAWGSAT